MLTSFLLLLINLIIIQCRGPHHPRGEPIAKHHVHYRPTKENPQKITQDEELLHDKAHIQEHLEEVIEEEDLSKMSDEELEFYYFQVHDTDKNSKLDGLEILQAIQHTQHHPKHSETDDDDDDESLTEESEENGFEYYVELIDRVFSEDDIDGDGYLSYHEYVAGRKKDIQMDDNLAKDPVVNVIT